MTFKQTLKLLEENIFKAASKEDAAKRQQEYALIHINKMLKKYGRQNHDGSWNIEGNININNLGLNEIPVKFNKVNGDFDCSVNNLTSLKGCPEIVTGIFDCSYNKLTLLKGCPKIIEGNFYCSYNNLTSLEGCPKIVEGDFYCCKNNVKFTEEDIKKYCKVKGYIHT